MSDISSQGFVIKRMPFKETSLLIDYFTREHGIIRLIAKGAKRSQKMQLQSEPFVEVQFNCNPLYDLPILKNAELGPNTFRLRGEALWCGLYLNELILKLLEPREHDHTLYDAYVDALIALSDASAGRQKPLRQFEATLLECLGYLHLAPMQMKQAHYQFVLHEGLVPCPSQHPQAISAQCLERIRLQQWDKETLLAGKMLFSQMIEHLLGEKKLMVKQTYALTTQ